MFSRSVARSYVAQHCLFAQNDTNNSVFCLAVQVPSTQLNHYNRDLRSSRGVVVVVSFCRAISPPIGLSRALLTSLGIIGPRAAL